MRTLVFTCIAATLVTASVASVVKAEDTTVIKRDRDEDTTVIKRDRDGDKTVIEKREELNVLPVPHTYTSTDNSAFPFTVTITTPASTGDSPVTPIRATDTNGLSSTVGFLPLLLPQAVTSAPSLSFISGLLLCLLLAVAATLVPRVKGRNPNYSFSGRLRRR